MKRVSLWNSPSGPPDDAPISPWLSMTTKASPHFSVRRSRVAEPVAAI